ncbi:MULTISPECIES: hypothetical protein [Methylomonas]|uniref:Uncharacterized protein n=1 Tax=Methylomonas koyamae TaxID=702114 RepID=A0A177NR66_9GAMM|nr:hypothetical protein [Methylomonas koyamae]OAI20362.1 hypothetical protein A1355_24055 [Methylomonas koyamae]
MPAVYSTLDWPVSIEIIQCAVKIITRHIQDAQQQEATIALLMTDVLLEYARASAQNHPDDAYRLHRTVQAMQRFLIDRFGADVPLDHLVERTKVIAILHRVSAVAS